MQPPKPGIYKDVPFDEYCQWDAINASRLKLALKSLRHFRAYVSRDAAHLKLGRADHTATLEPDKFPIEFTVFTERDIPKAVLGERPRNPGTPLKNQYPKQWQAFKEANASKSILSDKEYSDVLAMRDAVLSDPVAGPIITSKTGKPEMSMVWVDRTGLTCKGRADWILDGVMYDLKTARDVGERFNNAAIEYGYFLSAAYYMDGYVAATGKKLKGFEFICVENAPPWDVVVKPIPRSQMHHGHREYRKLLDSVANCKRTKVWPGISGGQKIDMEYPAWAIKEGSGVLLNVQPL